jgi:Aconitase B
MLQDYKIHCEDRKEQGIPPLPLSAHQTSELVELLKSKHQESELLLELLKERTPAGVDQSAYVKAGFLADITTGKTSSPYISKKEAVIILGTMLGGYNIQPLVKCLEDDELGEEAANALSKTLLIFDAFNEILELSETNKNAKTVINAWSEGAWFQEKEKIPEQIKLTVYKVPGEINTDDLSPATDAWSRPDIPLHALAMFKMPREGLERPLETIEELKKKGNPLVFVGDVVGTGSSRKSATNSVLWHMGDEIPCIPNKKESGFCFGGKIAPIFFYTL